MKSVYVVITVVCLLSGCDTLRFAPSESQKQNAWLHNRTAEFAADSARGENASEKLKGLTNLSAMQSRAITSYYGMPQQFPKVDTVDAVLSQSNIQLAQEAAANAAQRPDVWTIADNGLELGIGIAALFGGVFGTRAMQFLKDAKTKSTALKEIIEGNELFKKQNGAVSDDFKEAQKNQSVETRQLVAQMK
ncbi:MAG: hypothetical protein Q7T18_01360 [Sedimentisphaerales bacterium]|nr:hypothetical protein [Sedimentisphaerales bacterium]